MMGKFASTKNFGHGRSIGYAGHHALRESYQGRYATIESHSERWGKFVTWAKAQGIKDAQRITVEHLAQYAKELGELIETGERTVSYTQNLVSSVNVTLEAMREDRQVWISPSKAVGAQRNNVNDSAPASLDRGKVERAVADLRYQGWVRQAMVLDAARDLGLRAREAVMMNYREALQEATRTGKVNVTEGTKGGRGRDIDRLVPVSERAMRMLQQGAELQQELGGRNLIAPGETQDTALDSLRSTAISKIMKDHGIKLYHDARKAYACERYQQITGQPAPAVSGRREAPKTTDHAARLVISHELGHGRSDVLVAYVGSAR
jgi:site-specific recombinase XerD